MQSQTLILSTSLFHKQSIYADDPTVQSSLSEVGVLVIPKFHHSRHLSISTVIVTLNSVKVEDSDTPSWIRGELENTSGTSWFLLGISAVVTRVVRSRQCIVTYNMLIN